MKQSVDSSARRNKAILVLIAFAVFIVLGLPEGMLGVAWPSIYREFQLPLDALGGLLLAMSGAYLVASFANGPITQRLGTGGLLILGALLRTVGLAGYVVAPDWTVLLAFGLLHGFGSGLLDAGMNTHFAMKYSPRLMNWLHASFGLGATVGPILMTLALDLELSWRLAYAVAAGVQGLLALAVMLTRSDWHADADAFIRRPGAQTEHPARPLRRPTVWLGILFFFLYAGLEVTAGQWSFTLFTEGRGVAVTAAGFWVSVYWGVFTAGRLLYGFVSSERMTTAIVRGSALGAILGAALLWWTPADWVGFVGLALFGFSMAPIFPLMISATPRRIGARAATVAIGYQVGAASLGIAALPALAGVLAVRTSLEIVGPFLLAGALIQFALHEVIRPRTSVAAGSGGDAAAEHRA